MSAGYHEFFIEQGETFSSNVSLGNINNTIYDLSSYTAKGDIRRSYWSEDVSASFDISIDANNGVISVSLDANTTQSLVHSKYIYDLFLKHDVTGDRSKVLEGYVYIDRSVTKV